jgi:hypothetical protein
MKKLIILFLLISNIAYAQFDYKAFCKKTFKFSTFYAAASGGTSISDVDVFSVTNGLETSIVKTPFDYNLAFGIRKIARFGYENRANTFYDGTENSWSDAANIGKVSGLEFLFETDIKRQEGVDYVDQHHFIRYVGDWYILKGEYLQDGFADIEYFETSQRYKYNIGRLSLNAGLAQRMSEPYSYDPLEEWLLDNGGIHYTYLALQEGYNVDVYNSIYTDPSGEVVATSPEVWEEVVIPEMLANYTERKRDQLENKLQQSLVLGLDYYYYKKNFWLHTWANLMPWHYDDGGEYSYNNHKSNAWRYMDGKQWFDYSGGLIFGYKLNKHLGTFVEGKYNKYWNRKWYDFKCGINYVIF